MTKVPSQYLFIAIPEIRQPLLDGFQFVNNILATIHCKLEVGFFPIVVHILYLSNSDYVT